MSALGADYSWARPGGAALHAAGVTAVGRYLAADGRGITAAEYADLKAHGIGVWLVREGRASGMLGGRAQGVADAQASVALITNAGLPTDSVVFAAADWDVTDAQFAACDDYLRGFASVIGLARTGIYGGLHYLNHAFAAKVATAFWQAGATSWDHREAAQMQLNFHQTTETPPLPGTDHNYIYNTDALVGATPLPAVPTFDLGDKMIRIQAPNRGIALIGPNYYRQLNGDEEVAASGAIMEKHLDGNDRQFDLWVSIALNGNTDALVSRIAGTVWNTPVTRDGQTVTQLQDSLATGTVVRHLATTGVPVDTAAVANAVVAQLPTSGGVTVEQVEQTFAKVIGGTKLVAAS